MKTIEEEATRHAMVVKNDGSIAYNVGKYISFQGGAKWMREELTRWRDPVLDPPTIGQNVLIKTTDWSHSFIYLGFFDGDIWRADGGQIFIAQASSSLVFDGVVIGWREIYK